MNPCAFPFLIEPAHKGITFADTLEYFAANQSEIRAQLQCHGALLFRGFPIQGAAEFSKAVLGLGLGNFIDYKGGDSPRYLVADGVYTSTEAPPWLKIPLHNELSYSKHYPNHIYFFCETPCKIRGATPIADARKVLKSLDPDVRKAFSQKGLTYQSAYHGGKGLIPFLVGKGHRSWQEVFESTNREEVEKICSERGMRYRWTDDNWIVIEETRPATNRHPETEEEVWFNQAHIFKLSRRLLGLFRYMATKILYRHPDHRFHDVTFGDGSPLPFAMLEHVRDKLEENTIIFPWQKSDLLVLDNHLAMHGRESFKGKRRIYTAMTAP